MRTKTRAQWIVAVLVLSLTVVGAGPAMAAKKKPKPESATKDMVVELTELAAKRA